MHLTPQIYSFTSADRQRIEAIGYVIEGLPPGEPLETFMPRFLPNFDLRTLLEVVEQHFAPTTSLPVTRRISYRTASQIFQISFRNATILLDDSAIFDRIFFWQGKDLCVEHVYCLVPLFQQNKGLIKPVFQASLQQYVNVGVKKIIVHAALGGGGYTWARHGFVAVDRKEVEEIFDKANKQLSTNELAPVERIFSKYYSDRPNGTDFPMVLWAGLSGMKDVLRGSDWRGELDLHNPEQFRNFSDYVFRP